MVKTISKPISHEHACKVSRGIHDELTFGEGELDEFGYWEYPCYECARAWERKYPEDGPCWPFTEE
jgi:hypothetical protein